MRSVSVAVFPEPAAAETSSVLSLVSIADSCSSVHFLSAILLPLSRTGVLIYIYFSIFKVINQGGIVITFGGDAIDKVTRLCYNF